MVRKCDGTRLSPPDRCLIALASACGLLADGLHYLRDGRNLWSLGFGAVSLGATTTRDSGLSSKPLLSMALTANLPQLVLTTLYFLYNSLYTSMFTAFEWSRFALQKKSLRVSSPRGSQRSTYWLQLPWIYSLPISIAAAILHWLVSQSIFLVIVETFDPHHDLVPEDSFTTWGYSPYALVITIIVAGVTLFAFYVVGLRTLDTTMPFAGNSSLAISAACHRPLGDNDAHLLPVRWGAVLHETVDGPGHCCLTSFDVEPPIEGQWYK